MQKSYSFLENSKGFAIIHFAVLLTFLCGVASLVVDIGLVSFEKAKLSNAVDAATLAGAQELILYPENALNKANEYLTKNGVPLENATVTISNNDTINIIANKNVDYYFAKIFGLNFKNIQKSSTAKCGYIDSVSNGLRPFGIEDQSLDFGQTYVLKSGGGSGYDGNFGALALGGRGASTYLDNIIHGYDSSLSVGDKIYTETGNMSGPTSTGINTLLDSCHHLPKCTSANYNPDCPRIVSIIVVDSLKVNGRSLITIVGFASFLLEDVSGQGKDSIVTGSFLKTLSSGSISESQTDYGLKGIKLVKE